MKKKVFIGIIIGITLVVIGFLVDKVIVLKSQNEELMAENTRLSDRNYILRRQLHREITREDDLRDESSCPICRSDSVERIKYGLIYRNCVVSDWSKRYECQECGYKWGLELKLMHKSSSQGLQKFGDE